MPISFPQEAGLRDARRVIIRPFTKADTDALFAFFQSLPEQVKRYAWDRIDRREVVENWAYDLDYDKSVPLLAWDGTEVVADATLHYRKVGPLRRVGNLKWLLHPEWRGVGLGTVLINMFIEMARANGLNHLTCMLIAELEEDAIETLRSVGFSQYVIPNYGTDPDGNAKDMVKMILPL